MAAVKIGNKVILLNKDSGDKINADIVPSLCIRKTCSRIAPYCLLDEPDREIVFLTENEQLQVTNFPGQHYRKKP